MTIRLDDLTGPDIAAFIKEHVAEMREVSPPESSHALDLEGLRDPKTRFWTVWNGGALVGCGGLKRLNDAQGEIKGMRTHTSCRGAGIASHLLRHILADARESGLREVLLETGSFPFFDAARALYAKHGFVYCEPFGSYVEDPNSVFMNLKL